MRSGRRNIGLAVTEQGLTAVEVAQAEGRRTICRSAVLPLSGPADLQEPDKLGRALKQALRQGGFQARRCVIGLAANWLAAREKILPAAEAESLRGALSIAAERGFASGNQDLVFDYVPSPLPGGIAALLVAAPRRMVEDVTLLARAAGLTVSAVTASAAALAAQTRGPVVEPGRMVLCLLPGGVDVTAQSPAGLRLIRRLPVRLDGPGQLDGLVGELRRILSLDAAETQSGQARELLVWDCLGLDRAVLGGLGERLGAPMRLCKLTDDLELAVEVAQAGPVGEALAEAAALACGAKAGDLNFLRSRLAPPRQARLGRRVVLAGVLAAAVVATAAYLFLDWRAVQRDVARLETTLAAMRGGVQEAKDLVDNASFVRSWYDRRPRFLDCLKEITQAFPAEGKIWATSLMIKDDMLASLAGKSVNESAVLEVLDRLKANPRLYDVKPQFIRQAGGASREVSFAISLRLRGVN